MKRIVFLLISVATLGGVVASQATHLDTASKRPLRSL
jgi:hypothetical protein